LFLRRDGQTDMTKKIVEKNMNTDIGSVLISFQISIVKCFAVAA